MKLATIIGTVVSTQKYDRMNGFKYLLAQNVDFELNPEGSPFVLIDCVGAGNGELVLVAKGGEAMLAIGNNPPPIDKASVAIVDNVYYYKDA